MAWIESHQSLGRHPKLLRLALELKVHKAQAVGHLQFLWWWALDYARNGDLSAFASVEISTAAEWPGNCDNFFQSLIKTGWIDANGRLHDWDHYAGAWIDKLRRQTKYRKTTLKRRRGDGETTPNLTIPNLTIPNLTKPIERTRPKFVPPSQLEVEQFCREERLSLDAGKFVNYYASKGWLVGRSPMKDWKAAARGWISRQGEYNGTITSPGNAAAPIPGKYADAERRRKAQASMGQEDGGVKESPESPSLPEM